MLLQATAHLYVLKHLEGFEMLQSRILLSRELARRKRPLGENRT